MGIQIVLDWTPCSFVDSEDRNEQQKWPEIPEPNWWFSTEIRELGVLPSPDGFLASRTWFLFIISTTIQLPKLGIMKLSLSSNLNSVVVLGILVIQSKFECRLK